MIKKLGICFLFTAGLLGSNNPFDNNPFDNEKFDDSFSKTQENVPIFFKNTGYFKSTTPEFADFDIVNGEKDTKYKIREISKNKLKKILEWAFNTYLQKAEEIKKFPAPNRSAPQPSKLLDPYTLTYEVIDVEDYKNESSDIYYNSLRAYIMAKITYIAIKNLEDPRAKSWKGEGFIPKTGDFSYDIIHNLDLIFNITLPSEVFNFEKYLEILPEECLWQIHFTLKKYLELKNNQ